MRLKCKVFTAALSNLSQFWWPLWIKENVLSLCWRPVSGLVVFWGEILIPLPFNSPFFVGKVEASGSISVSSVQINSAQRVLHMTVNTGRKAEGNSFLYDKAFLWGKIQDLSLIFQVLEVQFLLCLLYCDRNGATLCVNLMGLHVFGLLAVEDSGDTDYILFPLKQCLSVFSPMQTSSAFWSQAVISWNTAFMVVCLTILCPASPLFMSLQMPNLISCSKQITGGHEPMSGLDSSYLPLKRHFLPSLISTHNGYKGFQKFHHYHLKKRYKK